MISVSTNLRAVISAKLEQISSLKNNPDPILRTVAMAVLTEFKQRIHIDGKDSNGGQIGTYSSGYMVVRTGNYKDAARFKRGDKAGQFKDRKSEAKGEAGVTKNRTSYKAVGTVVVEHSNAGANRKVYNRTSDTKVILSLTRQMENDLNIIPSGNGYGIGYLNKDNYQKALWCEETYHKKILTKLTKEEKELAIHTAINFTPEYLKSI
jgi:hypothetical protein